VIFTVIAAASLGAALRESHLLEPTEITFESNRAPLGIIRRGTSVTPEVARAIRAKPGSFIRHLLLLQLRYRKPDERRLRRLQPNNL
jgi:hypothetical protein